MPPAACRSRGTVSGIAAGSLFNVTVTDAGVTKTYIATVNIAGTGWTATIPSTDAVALANGTATVSAQVTDANGNQASLQPGGDGGRDRPDADHRSAVEGNNVINFAEAHAAGGVPLSGHGERDCRRQPLQRHGHRRWRDQDLHRHRQHRRHRLDRDDSLDRRRCTGQRHRDGVGAGHRCQRQPGVLKPER